jgi:hypothetical protein
MALISACDASLTRSGYIVAGFPSCVKRSQLANCTASELATQLDLNHGYLSRMHTIRRLVSPDDASSRGYVLLDDRTKLSQNTRQGCLSFKGGTYRWDQYCPGLQDSLGGLVDRCLPGSGHVHDACILAASRSCVRSHSISNVLEECAPSAVVWESRALRPHSHQSRRWR